jgi:hypothetical protein
MSDLHPDERPTAPPPPLARPAWMPLEAWWLIEPELARWEPKPKQEST